MIGIPESELSRAQANVEPRLSARVNCGPVNDVLRTAIAFFRRIFVAKSAARLTMKYPTIYVENKMIR